MKHMLVATDGSEGANRAVDFAAHLAKDDGAELLIVNIMGGYGLPDGLFSTFTRAKHAWLKELLASLSAEILTKARDRARNVGVEGIQVNSCAGDIASTIIEIARERQVDAIVVGKRGAGRVGGLLLGSVSQKLVSLAPLPVTVVP